MRLPYGKVPGKVLEKMVLRSLTPDGEVVVGPGLGVDFAVVKGGGRYLVVSSDPVTGADANVGWYAVNICANDVATSGARPRFLETVILLPHSTDPEMLGEISAEINSAASEIGMTVIGGHSEATPGLEKAIVIGTAMGFADRFVTSRDAKAGDLLLMTKTAAIEGTTILALQHRQQFEKDEPELARRLQALRSKISVVKDSVTAFETGFVHAMHDPTEGGILGGVYEMSLASGLGFELVEEEIPLAEETRTICGLLNVDPLKLISSGALLIAVDREHGEEIGAALNSKGIETSEVGKLVREERTLVRRDGGRETIRDAPVDELWALDSAGRRKT